MIKDFQLLRFKSMQLNIFEFLLKNVLQNKKVFSKMNDGILWSYEDTIIAWYISDFVVLTICLYWIRFACVINCILHPAQIMAATKGYECTRYIFSGCPVYLLLFTTGEYIFIQEQVYLKKSFYVVSSKDISYKISMYLFL